MSGLTPSQEELLNRLADAIVRRGMAAPALFFIESSKPMAFIGGQFMTFLDPIIKTFVTIPGFEEIPAILEDRDNIDRFMAMIESRDDEARQKQTRTPPAGSAGQTPAAVGGETAK